MVNDYSEDKLIEQPAIKLFQYITLSLSISTLITSDTFSPHDVSWYWNFNIRKSF